MTKAKIYATLVISHVLLLSCSPYKSIKCPNGSSVNVLKNIDDAFPVYAKEYTIEFEAKAKELKSAVDTIGIETKAGFRTKIVAFRNKLDQEYALLQDQLKTAVLNSQRDPCDKESGNRLHEIQQRTIEASERLKELDIVDKVTEMENMEKISLAISEYMFSAELVIKAYDKNLTTLKNLQVLVVDKYNPAISHLRQNEFVFVDDIKKTEDDKLVEEFKKTMTNIKQLDSMIHEFNPQAEKIEGEEQIKADPQITRPILERIFPVFDALKKQTNDFLSNLNTHSK